MDSSEATGTVVIKPLPGQGRQAQASHAEEEEEEEGEEEGVPSGCLHACMAGCTRARAVTCCERRKRNYGQAKSGDCQACFAQCITNNHYCVAVPYDSRHLQIC